MSDATASSSPAAAESPRPARSGVGFREGGFVILGAFLLTLLVVAVVVPPIVERVRTRPPGDGQDPRTYAFALEPASITPEQLVPAQHHRDLTMPLTDPEVAVGAEMGAQNEAMRGKYLVSDDPVIGIVAGGEARAYPLRNLAFHEAINDVVGGVPVLVVASPMSQVMAAYDRRAAGRTIELGVSGLLHDASTMLYDRTRDAETGAIVHGGESLWSPVTGAALTGPDHAAGTRLARLPLVLTQWSRWLEAHPETTVLGYDADLHDRAKRIDYSRYWASDTLEYPIDPMPPADGADALRPKAFCIAVFAGGEEASGAAAPLALIAGPDVIAAIDAASASTEEAEVRIVRVDVAGRPLEVRHLRDRRQRTVIEVVDARDGSPVPSIVTSWFAAWAAGWGEARVPRAAMAVPEAAPVEG